MPDILDLFQRAAERARTHEPELIVLEVVSEGVQIRISAHQRTKARYNRIVSWTSIKYANIDILDAELTNALAYFRSAPDDRS